MKVLRRIAAFLIAPPVAGGLFLFLGTLGGPGASRSSLLAGVALVSVIGLVAALILGLPLLYLFRRLGWRSRLGFALGGALLVLVVYAVALGRFFYPLEAALAAFAGAVAGLVFAYVGGWLQRSAPSKPVAAT